MPLPVRQSSITSCIYIQQRHDSKAKEAAALRRRPKRRKGVEKKGLWSLSSSYTVAGGHLFIMASCCSVFTTLSCLVLMYTRRTFSTSSPSSSLNRAPVNASNGPGLNSIAANVESCNASSSAKHFHACHLN